VHRPTLQNIGEPLILACQAEIAVPQLLVVLHCHRALAKAFRFSPIPAVSALLAHAVVGGSLPAIGASAAQPKALAPSRRWAGWGKCRTLLPEGFVPMPPEATVTGLILTR
jgi:hypothetical protein